MAKELYGRQWNHLNRVKRPRPPHAKYDWDSWFNGRTWLLLPGEDWPKKWDNRYFRGYVLKVASQKNLRVKTTLEANGGLYIRKVGSARRKKAPKDPVIEAVLRGDPIPDTTEEDT